MDDDRHFPQPSPALSGPQAEVLRKHLARGTMSLDDAAILTGIPVEDLSQHFQGRRAARAHGEHHSGERRSSHRHQDDDDEYERDGVSLHAPERRSHRTGRSGNKALWASGILAGVAVLGGLAVLSGIPQSLLFAPRGVSESKDPAATSGLGPTASVEGPIGEAPAAPAPVEEAVAAAPIDPVPTDPAALAPADPAVDPNLADPNAVPPTDAASAEPVVPAAPEEVAPATAVAESETAFDPTAPAAVPAPVVETAPTPAAAPSTVLYATRAAAVRDTPTAGGSATVGQLKRGDSVSGSIVTGADGKSPWLKIESGPGAGGYVSAANMADGPRPRILQSIGQARAVVQGGALQAAPDAGSATLDTLSPGIMVYAAAEVEGGWIEIQRRAGGVGYVRKEAFEQPVP